VYKKIKVLAVGYVT